MSTTPLPFNYGAPLTGRNIRLLKFKRRDDNPRSSKKCMHLELAPAALPNETSGIEEVAVRYLALSYVWGKSDEDNPEILINGTQFKVTPNLGKALSHLETEIDLPIWVDAVCINQNDDEEKAEQVAQMRDIYTYAVRTIIWLGEGDNTSDRVMKHLVRVGQDAAAAGLYELSGEDIRNWPNFGSTEAKIQIRNELEALFPKMSRGYEDRAPFPLKDVIAMSELPWFTRVWIVQELSVSSDYTFMCGKSTVPGDYFTAAFTLSSIWVGHEARRLLRDEPLFMVPFRMFSMWWRNGWSFVKVFMGIFRGKRNMVSARATTTLSTRRKWQRDRPTLKQQLCRAFVLATAEGLDATNPRDRIYAFLGIASDAKELGIDPIDYKITTATLYSDVARKMIQKGHLDVLSLCRPPASGKPRDEKLPSWAPDWEKRILPPWGGLIEAQGKLNGGENIEDSVEANAVEKKNQSLFHASGADQVQWTPSTSDKVLVIKARYVGKLKELGTTWDSGWDEEFDLQMARKIFMDIVGFLQKSNRLKGVLGDVFWRIPIGDKESSAFGQDQRATVISLNESRVMMNILTGKQRLGKSAKMTSYLGAMKDMHNAKPFLSDDASGGYVGLCPGESEVDDEIFIPLGAHVPYVFRKAEDGCFKVVGEAYVQGLMDGEALNLDMESREVQLI